MDPDRDIRRRSVVGEQSEWRILARSGAAFAAASPALGLAGTVGAATGGGERLAASNGGADNYFGEDVAMSASTP